MQTHRVTSNGNVSTRKTMFDAEIRRLKNMNLEHSTSNARDASLHPIIQKDRIPYSTLDVRGWTFSFLISSASQAPLSVCLW